jgi:hypothetical protein
MTYAFDALLQEFATAKGFEASASAQGMAFECEGIEVWIVQHPLHEDRLLVEVGVAAWEEEPPAAVLALMLQINEAARFEHDWAILMDASLAISLSTSVALPGLTLAQLEALMLDGVERGQSLQSMLSEALASQSDNEGTPQASADLQQLTIVRG